MADEYDSFLNDVASGKLDDLIGHKPASAVQRVATQDPEQGDFMRGLSNYVPQIKEMANAGEALAGEGIRRTFGEGRVGNYLRDSGLAGMDAAKAEQVSKDTDSFTGALKNGVGSVVTDWLPYQMGQGVGNLGEMAVAAGVGALAGTAAAPGVGTVAGAVGGAVGKTAAKQAAIAGARKIAIDRGVKGGVATMAGFHGVGEVGSRAIDENGLENVDFSKVVPAMVGHGAAEYFGDRIIMGALNPKVPTDLIRKTGVTAAAKAAGKGVLVTGSKEAPVEIVQTGLERFGAKMDLMSGEAGTEYIDSAAAAYGMSSTPGAIGGLRQHFATPTSRPVPPPIVPPPTGTSQDMFSGENTPVNVYQQAMDDAVNTVGATDAQGELFAPRVMAGSSGYGAVGSKFDIKASQQPPRVDPTTGMPIAPLTAVSRDWTATPAAGTSQDMFSGEFTDVNVYQQAMDDAAAQLQATDAQAEMFAPAPMAGSTGYGSLTSKSKAAPAASVDPTTGMPVAPLTTTGERGALPNMTSSFGVTDSKGPAKATGSRGKAEATEKTPAEKKAPRNPVKRADLESTIDAHLAAGRITQEQHEQLISESQMGAAIEKVKKSVAAAIVESAPVTKETPSAAVITDAKGNKKEVKTAPKFNKTNNREILIPASEPVATIPHPEAPTNEAEESEYNDKLAEYLVSGVSIEDQALVSTRFNTDEARGRSALSILAKQLGMTREGARKRAIKALSGIKANAAKAGVDWEKAKATLDINTDKTRKVADGEVVTVDRGDGKPDNFEFDETAGMVRNETGNDEEVKTDEEAEVTEEEVSTEDVISDKVIQDAAESALGEYPSMVIDLTADVYGKGFADLSFAVQLHFVEKVAQLARMYGHDEKLFYSKAAKELGVTNVKSINGGKAEGSPQKPEGQSKGVGEGRGGDAESVVVGKADVSKIKVVSKKKKTVVRNSRSEAPYGRSNTTANIKGILKGLFGASKSFDRLVTVVKSIDDLPKAVREDENFDAGAQGITFGDHIYLIADNLPRGDELAVFLHEAGAHLGFDTIFAHDPKAREWLANHVRSWADGKDKKLREAARRALKKGGTSEDEIVAYMVEELVRMGVKPVGAKIQNRWMRKVYAAFKSALRHLGFRRDIDPQGLVDLAFGAAHLEMRGAWHGTAAQFRKFNHDFLSTGEGMGKKGAGQAFGAGTYLAQRFGLGKAYWAKDVKNKEKGKDAGTLMRVVADMHDDEMLDLDLPIWKQSKKLQKIIREHFGDTHGASMFPDMYMNMMGLDDVQEAQDAVSDTDGQWLYEVLTIGNALYERPNEFTEDQFGRRMPTEASYLEAQNDTSKYLDSIGIKGNLFRDRSSRTTNDIEFIGAVPRARKGMLDNLLAFMNSSANNGVSVSDMLADYADIMPGFQTELSELSESDFVANRVHRNMVVFNDKNLIKVKDSVGEEGIAAMEESKSRGSRNSAPARDEKTITYGSQYLYERAAKHVKKKGYTSARVESRVDGKVDVTWVKNKLRNSVASATVDAAARLGSEKAVVDTVYALKKSVGWMTYLHDLVRSVSNSMPSAKVWYDGILKKQETRLKMERDAEKVAVAAGKLTQDEQKEVNAFIAESTVEQVWGYAPEWNKGATVDKDMEAKWKLLTEEQRRVVDAVFKHGYDSIQYKRNLFRKLGVEDVMSQLGAINGPYAPLKRFGGFVAVLKSQKVLDAEAALKEFDNKATRDAVEEAKKSAEDYMVSTFDTPGQAREFAKSKEGEYAFTDSFASSNKLKADQVMSYQVLDKVMNAVKADPNLPPAVREEMESTVRALYLSSLDETNARQSGQKRKNRSGYDTDMVRAFLASARADAAYIANMEHGSEINEAFYKMQEEESKSDSGHRVNQDEFNLIVEHYAESMKYEATPIQDRVVGLTSAWQLSTSLGYHLANMMQGIMVTLPRLAAEGNYGGAWKHLMNGYSVTAKAMVGMSADLSKIEDGGLRSALELASNRGILDVGIEEDLGQFDQFKTGYKAVDGSSRYVGMALHKLRSLARYVETINRVSSGTAAYNQAIEQGKTAEEAQEFVIDILQSTQGDFSRTGAPLLLKKLPKPMVQYRKYQFMMMAFYVKGFHQAFKGASPEERLIGKRMMAFKLTHTAVAAGVLGLPLMNLVAMAFGRDDEDPEDLEQRLTRIIGNGTLAKLLLHGVSAVTPLDMSAKLDESKVFSIAPYTDFDLSSKAGVANTVMGIVGGPAFGQVGKMADGIGLMMDGQIVKGIEKQMPKGVADTMSAFRMANEGYTLKNGDVAVKPEDISAWAIALTAAGLPAAQVKDIVKRYGIQYEMKMHFDEQQKSIKSEYGNAWRDKDSKKMSELRKRWMNLQRQKKGVRRDWFANSPNELKMSPLSTLIRSPMAEHKREVKTQRAMKEA